LKAHKSDKKYLVKYNEQEVIDLTTNAVVVQDENTVKLALEAIKRLRVPRKPQWDGIKSAEEQMLAENVKLKLIGE
jgi:sRNA-binding carbon storage regulator CsrA